MGIHTYWHADYYLRKKAWEIYVPYNPESISLNPIILRRQLKM